MDLRGCCELFGCSMLPLPHAQVPLETPKRSCSLELWDGFSSGLQCQVDLQCLPCLAKASRAAPPRRILHLVPSTFGDPETQLQLWNSGLACRRLIRGLQCQGWTVSLKGLPPCLAKASHVLASRSGVPSSFCAQLLWRPRKATAAWHHGLAFRRLVCRLQCQGGLVVSSLSGKGFGAGKGSRACPSTFEDPETQLQLQRTGLH